MFKTNLQGAPIYLFVISAFAAAQTPTTTALISSPNPANLGHPVTLTATVTTGATGKVTFYDGATILGINATSASQATWTTVLLPSGTRSLRAYYEGDAAHSPSSSAMIAEAVHALPSLSLGRPVNYAAGSYPNSVLVSDFNGDGREDLAIADTGSPSGIGILLGTGSGGFQPVVNYAVPATAYYLAAGDFNGDGKPDLVVSNGFNVLSILLGNGDGTFQPANSFHESADFVGPFALTDLNGDGKADLVFAGVIVLGNGDGTFQSPRRCTTPYLAETVAVGDFNGDGKADVAVAGLGYVSVFEGNGDGSLGTATTYTFGASLSYLLAGDLNGDGKLDLVAVDRYSGLGVLLGNGDGTFQPAVNYLAMSRLTWAAVGDINGDGRPDLVTVDYNSGAISLGNGDGTFQAPTSFPVTAAYGVSVGDFNGDGLTDVVVPVYAVAPDYTSLGLVSVYLGGENSSPSHKPRPPFRR